MELAPRTLLLSTDGQLIEVRAAVADVSTVHAASPGHCARLAYGACRHTMSGHAAD